MKKRFILLAAIPMLLCSCGAGGDKEPSGYDYIVGNDYSDLVKITIKYANNKYHNGEVYKTWGVKRGTAPGMEPKFPDTKYITAKYGLSSNLKPSDSSSLIDFKTYIFNSDTTIYVKYYGGMQKIKWCIPNGPTQKGAGMMFEQQNIFENTEVYTMPTLDKQYMESDWGNINCKETLTHWVTSWGWSKIDSWYYDQNLTQPVSLPFYFGSTTQFWAKCS